MKKATEGSDAQIPSGNVYVKMWHAKQEIGKVYKNATNPHFKRSYADLNAILETVEPILLAHGLLLLQPIEDGKVITMIYDPETETSISSSMTLPEATTPQQIGSCISYYRRYSLTSLCCLQSTDDDGEAASKPKAKPTATNELVDKFLVSLKAGSNKWSAEKFISTYALTEDQIIKIQQL
tara:strand:- start:1537 stop:2079 length:543 start_codon:yes stop_codon:yes gene_type:complete